MVIPRIRSPPPPPPPKLKYIAPGIQCKICTSGPTDKHMPIVFESLYGELQGDGSHLSELWAQKSVKSRPAKPGEGCDPFVMPDAAGRIYLKTRLAGGKFPLLSHGGNYFLRHLSKTIDVIETHFLALQGRPRGLTVGVEFSTGPNLWLGVLVISQMHISLLSVRPYVVETQENHRAAPLPEIVESLSPRYMGG